MFIFQVCGFSGSGKTTLIKSLIPALKTKSLRIASIKDIHYKGFHIDEPGKDTAVHREAGADPVVARGHAETDFLYDQKMSLMEIVPLVSADWLIVEGFRDFPLPRIVCGNTEEDVEAFLDERTFAVSGPVSATMNKIRDLPLFDADKSDHIETLARLIEEKVFPLLPYRNDCSECGMRCEELAAAIIQGRKKYEDCSYSSSEITLMVGGVQLPMNPFVRNILKKTVQAIVSELKGWEEGKEIELHIS